jgi:2-hydroxycyclohexanecarboxyl-CoA dehydrogenase
LINNAGITSPTKFLDVTGEEWDRIFAVNVRGSYNITRRVVPGMVERGFGRIVFLVLSVSRARRRGIRCRGVFGGKGCRTRFARALARELGPNGVTANAVAPGFIETDISGGALTGERKDQLVAGIPVGRGGNVNDVADLITFLCREESGYITGVTYDVNGGSHITDSVSEIPGSWPPVRIEPGAQRATSAVTTLSPTLLTYCGAGCRSLVR